jgi:hypothetical protein
MHRTNQSPDDQGNTPIRRYLQTIIIDRIDCVDAKPDVDQNEYGSAAEPASPRTPRSLPR